MANDDLDQVTPVLILTLLLLTLRNYTPKDTVFKIIMIIIIIIIILTTFHKHAIIVA